MFYEAGVDIQYLLDASYFIVIYTHEIANCIFNSIKLHNLDSNQHVPLTRIHIYIIYIYKRKNKLQFYGFFFNIYCTFKPNFGSARGFYNSTYFSKMVYYQIFCSYRTGLSVFPFFGIVCCAFDLNHSTKLSIILITT